jgi:hypothetical protein
MHPAFVTTCGMTVQTTSDYLRGYGARNIHLVSTLGRSKAHGSEPWPTSRCSPEQRSTRGRPGRICLAGGRRAEREKYFVNLMTISPCSTQTSPWNPGSLTMGFFKSRVPSYCALPYADAMQCVCPPRTTKETERGKWRRDNTG